MGIEKNGRDAYMPSVRVTEEELTEWREAAKRSTQSFSDWVRESLGRVADGEATGAATWSRVGELVEALTESDDDAREARWQHRVVGWTVPTVIIEADGTMHHEGTPRASVDGVEEALAHALTGSPAHLPAERLVLRGSVGDNGLAVWPLTSARTEASIGGALYPEGVELVDGDIVIESPLMGLVYQRRPYQPGDAVTHRNELHERLRQAREQAGVTQREVAESRGLTGTAISGVERGSDPRLSAIEAYLDSLPGLRPQDVLAAQPDVEVTDGPALEYLRQLHGVEAKSIAKSVQIDDEGSRETEVVTTGLRSLRGSVGEWRFALPALRLTAQCAASVLKEVLPEDEGGLLETCKGRWGDGSFLLTVPRAPARSGLTLTRRFQAAWAFSTSQAQAQERHPGEPFLPRQEGALVPVHHPVSSVRVGVELPHAGKAFGYALPIGLLPDEDRPPLSSYQTPPKVKRRRCGGRVRLSVVVENPLPGMAYGLGWYVR